MRLQSKNKKNSSSPPTESTQTVSRRHSFDPPLTHSPTYSFILFQLLPSYRRKDWIPHPQIKIYSEEKDDEEEEAAAAAAKEDQSNN